MHHPEIRQTLPIFSTKCVNKDAQISSDRAFTVPMVHSKQTSYQIYPIMHISIQAIQQRQPITTPMQVPEKLVSYPFRRSIKVCGENPKAKLHHMNMQIVVSRLKSRKPGFTKHTNAECWMSHVYNPESRSIHLPRML